MQDAVGVSFFFPDFEFSLGFLVVDLVVLLGVVVYGLLLGGNLSLVLAFSGVFGVFSEELLLALHLLDVAVDSIVGEIVELLFLFDFCRVLDDHVVLNVELTHVQFHFFALHCIY